MKASRFSDAQKALILKQGSEGILVADICRKAGISQPPISSGSANMAPGDLVGRRFRRPDDQQLSMGSRHASTTAFAWSPNLNS
jgi:hypothetical protein